MPTLDASLLFATDPSDPSSVAAPLATAAKCWRRGQGREALTWLRRAVQAATEAGLGHRARALAAFASELSAHVVKVGADGARPRRAPATSASRADTVPLRQSAEAEAPSSTRAAAKARERESGKSIFSATTRVSATAADAWPTEELTGDELPTELAMGITMRAVASPATAPGVPVRVKMWREGGALHAARHGSPAASSAPANAAVVILTTVDPDVDLARLLDDSG